MVTLHIVSLVFGLASVGSLFLAVTTDYWLYTSEPFDFEKMILEGQAEITGEEFPPDVLQGWDDGDELNETVQILLPTHIQLHSGLWRSCVYYEDGYPSQCVTIGYGQTWERVEGGDTTNSILRSMRRSSPVIVLSLLVLMFALGTSTVGNSKRDNKTIFGAIQYVIGALTLAAGMIVYISAVNDEVSRRKKPSPYASAEYHFRYYYGWDISFAAAAFICALLASVSNISLYIRRFTHLEEMALVIPGLEKHTGYDPVNLIEMDVLNNHLNNHGYTSADVML